MHVHIDLPLDQPRRLTDTTTDIAVLLLAHLPNEESAIDCRAQQAE
jgi:hypothetical protein